MATILISADMEGVAGLTDRKQVMRDSAEFARSCRLMTAEVAAACQGASEAGATSIVVNAGTPYKLAIPLTLDVDLMNAEMADQCELMPEAVRTGGTRIRLVKDDFVALYRAFRIACILSATML